VQSSVTQHLPSANHISVRLQNTNSQMVLWYCILLAEYYA
jgi:hypothetical protein